MNTTRITEAESLPDSDTWLDPQQIGVPRLGLGDRPTIVFELGDVAIEARIEKAPGRPDYWLTVRGLDLGSRLSVTPVAANAIQVRPTK